MNEDPRAFLNCGFFSMNHRGRNSKAFYQNLSNGLECVDASYKSKQPFIYGIHSLWRDSYVCESYIYSNDGRVYRQFLDFDVFGGLDTSGERAAYYEQTCEKIEVVEKPMFSYLLNHISDGGCEDITLD